MKTELFDYHLPEELIAAHPPERRDGGRLLVLSPDDGHRHHTHIREIGAHLEPGTLLVVNDTRVIPARIHGARPTGGAVEVLFVRPLEDLEDSSRWLALARANRPLRPGDPIDLRGLEARIVGRLERGETELVVDCDVAGLQRHLQEHGEVPLPPYIRRTPDASDLERYQTTYARHDGSVAAPTAGLHFTEDLLAQLKERGCEVGSLTLHVGPGTFRPIASDDLADHRMDAERYVVGPQLVEQVRRAKQEGRPVIAVGTTSVRALEGCAAAHGELTAGTGFTEIFISPGFPFRVVDGLITNFHLPKSTLICLVSALASREMVLDTYAEAVAQRYRFYSYGDAMFILPRNK